MAVADLQINPVAVLRIKSLLQDPAYKESIEQSANYNTRLCLERKMRLPFLDAQTGVAQSNCCLWMSKRNRMPGQAPGQLYTYPSKRWRKKRRQYLINFLRPTRTRDLDINESDIHQISTVENPAAKVDADDKDEKATEDSKDSWYRDYEDASEPPDAGEIDDPESDYDDYEETYTKRRRKKLLTLAARTGTPKLQTTTRGKRKEKVEIPDSEKPFVCDTCGARYKTRPGLTYHVTHSHNGHNGPSTTQAVVVTTEVTDDENTAPSPPAKPTTSSNDPLAGLGTGVPSVLAGGATGSWLASLPVQARRVGRPRRQPALTATSASGTQQRTRRQGNQRNSYPAQTVDGQVTLRACSSRPT